MFWSDILTFRLDDETAKSKQLTLAEHNERTVCWCNQSQLRYSIIRVPQKYADLDGVVWSISQVILCVSSKYCGRLNCSAFFSSSSRMYALVKVFYKSSDFFVHSNQNKPYPSLCVKPTSRLTIRKITNAQQKDFCFRIKVWFSDALRLGRVNLSRSVNPTYSIWSFSGRTRPKKITTSTDLHWPGLTPHLKTATASVRLYNISKMHPFPMF